MMQNPGNGERWRSLLCAREALASTGRRDKMRFISSVSMQNYDILRWTSVSGEDSSMDVNEKNLSRAGFKYADIQKIRRNVDAHGGTFSEALQDLANRFRILLCVISGCVLVFVLLLSFGSEDSIISGGIALLCGAVIAMLSQPPMLSYKSWRYFRYNRR